MLTGKIGLLPAGWALQLDRGRAVRRVLRGLLDTMLALGRRCRADHSPLLLVVIASAFHGIWIPPALALVIGSLAWFGPARQIRAQRWCCVRPATC